MLRSCYSSRWRLFNGVPTETAGRYIFVPENTPAYPHPHNVWSRNWITKEVQGYSGLGEVPEAPHQYYNGATGPEAPNARILGSPECIERGEQPGRVALRVINGFPEGCFVTDPIPLPPVSLIPNVLDRFTWTQYAGILDLSYDFPSAVVDIMEGLFPDNISISVVGSDGELTPRTYVVRTPNFTVVFMPGTSTDDQLAYQVATLSGGPVDMGAFSTSLFWFQRSSIVIGRLEALGVDFDKPVFLAGHSYGAVLATLVAARLLQGDPNRSISLLTYGMPKPGDDRLLDLLIPTIQVHLANQGDPVPDLPPRRNQIVGTIIPFPPGFLERWEQMRAPRARVVIQGNGSTAYSQEFTASPSDWFGFATDIISGDPVRLFAAHEIKSYLSRLIIPQ